MTISISNTLVTNTFDFWRNRTNELAYAMSSNAVTVNSTKAIGSAAISGDFSANTVTVANSTSQVVVTVPTTVQVNDGNYYLNANGQWSLVSTTSEAISNIKADVFSTSGTSDLLLDSFLKNAYNAAEYVINSINGTSTSHSAVKILLYHNNADAYLTEYATMNTGTPFNTFSANANTTHVRLWVKSTSSTSSIKYFRVVV